MKALDHPYPPAARIRQENHWACTEQFLLKASGVYRVYEHQKHIDVLMPSGQASLIKGQSLYKNTSKAIPISLVA